MYKSVKIRKYLSYYFDYDFISLTQRRVIARVCLIFFLSRNITKGELNVQSKIYLHRVYLKHYISVSFLILINNARAYNDKYFGRSFFDANRRKKFISQATWRFWLTSSVPSVSCSPWICYFSQRPPASWRAACGRVNSWRAPRNGKRILPVRSNGLENRGTHGSPRPPLSPWKSVSSKLSSDPGDSRAASPRFAARFSRSPRIWNRISASEGKKRNICPVKVVRMNRRIAYFAQPGTARSSFRVNIWLNLSTKNVLRWVRFYRCASLFSNGQEAEFSFGIRFTFVDSTGARHYATVIFRILPGIMPHSHCRSTIFREPCSSTVWIFIFVAKLDLQCDMLLMEVLLLLNYSTYIRLKDRLKGNLL